MGGVSTDFDNFLNVLMSLLPSARMVRLICVLISSYKRSANDYLSSSSGGSNSSSTTSNGSSSSGGSGSSRSR